MIFFMLISSILYIYLLPGAGKDYKTKRPCMYEYTYRDAEYTCYHSVSHIPHGMHLIDFAADRKSKEKRPIIQGRKIRGTTLLQSIYINRSLNRPEKPWRCNGRTRCAYWKRSTHCSQNELHLTISNCLAPPGNSLELSFRLLFLLKRICLIYIVS